MSRILDGIADRDNLFCVICKIQVLVSVGQDQRSEHATVARAEQGQGAFGPAPRRAAWRPTGDSEHSSKCEYCEVFLQREMFPESITP